MNKQQKIEQQLESIIEVSLSNILGRLSAQLGHTPKHTQQHVNKKRKWLKPAQAAARTKVRIKDVKKHAIVIGADHLTLRELADTAGVPYMTMYMRYVNSKNPTVASLLAVRPSHKKQTPLAQ